MIKSYFTAQIAQIASKPTLDDQGYRLFESGTGEAMKVYQLQESLSWLNMRAIEEAYNDMAKMPVMIRMRTEARLARTEAVDRKRFLRYL